MTRSEFLDNITEWYELKDFCNDFDCDVCEDIYDDDDYDDCVEEDIRDAIADYGWRDIRDFLGNLPSGYDYYRRNSTLDYDGLGDDDFEDYKEDVLEWGVIAVRAPCAQSDIFSKQFPGYNFYSPNKNYNLGNARLKMKNPNPFFCFKREDTTRLLRHMYVVNLQSGLYHSG